MRRIPQRVLRCDAVQYTSHPRRERQNHKFKNVQCLLLAVPTESVYAPSIVSLSRNEGLTITRCSSYVVTTTSSDNSQVLQPTLIIWPRNPDHKRCTKIGRNFHFCYIWTKVPTRCTTITSLWADSVLFCKWKPGNCVLRQLRLDWHINRLH